LTSEERKARELERLRSDLSTIDLSELNENIRCISTGVVAFDLAMGGGWPESRFSEIFGEWQSGKSLIMYQSIKECQAAGGLAFLDDSERAFDKRWARALGINLDELFYFISTSIEHGFEHLEKVCHEVRKSPEFRDVPILYVKDSLAASIAKEEADMTFEKTGIALQARAVSKGLRRLTNLIADQRVAVVFVNQIRTKVGVMFGPSSESTGGRAPKFYAGMRIGLYKKSKIKRAGRIVGMGGLFDVVKSKIGVPWRQVKFQMLLKTGVHALSGLFEYFISESVIKQLTTRSFEFAGDRFKRQDFPAMWADAGKREALLMEYKRVQEEGVDEEPQVAEGSSEEE